MTSSRVQRARETERLEAAYLQANGWPHAEAVRASLPGTDILGCPGLAIEIKARRDLNLNGWLKQAMSRPGLPILIVRPDWFGPEKQDLWPMIFPQFHGVKLLRDAGYGGPSA